MNREICVEGKIYRKPKCMSHLTDQDFAELIKSNKQISFLEGIGAFFILGLILCISVVLFAVLFAPWIFGLVQIVKHVVG